jgi:hypothetical protein
MPGMGDPAASSLSEAITAGAPGAPTLPVVALNGSSGQVHVSWAAPTGGGEVTYYSVVSDPMVTNPGGCTNVTAPTVACDFTGLTPGTAYQFTVTAHGALGMPTAGAPSAPITPGAPGDPDRPTVALTGIAGQVRVTWGTPSNPGAGIAGYSVRASDVPANTEGCAAAAVDPTATTCVVAGLAASKTYTFTVQALGVQVNGHASGNSGWSVASDPITLNPPTDVEVAAGDRQIAVSWSRPSGDGTGILSYVAVVTPGSASCVTTSFSDTDCVITGLTNRTTYTVTVTARGAGNAVLAASMASARVRPTAGPPGRPTEVRAVALDNRTVVTWTPPVETGDGIGRYTATATGTGWPGGKTCFGMGATATTCTIDGLTNGEPYTVSVVANGIAASGNSTPTTPVTVIPNLPPGAPTNVTGTLGSDFSSLIVTFARPTWTGPLSFAVTSTPVAGGTTSSCPVPSSTSTTPSCVITGVTPGASYTVRVTATAASGASSTQASAVVQALGAPVPTSAPGPGPVTGVMPLVSSAGNGPLAGGSTTTLSVTGGFTPYAGIRLDYYPGPITVTGMASRTGGFSIPFTIPTGTGMISHTIVASGMQPSGTIRYRTLTISAPSVQSFGVASPRNSAPADRPRRAPVILPERKAALIRR